MSVKSCQKFIGCCLYDSNMPCIFIHPKGHWPDLMSDLKCTDFYEKYYAVYDFILLFTNFILHCPLLLLKIYERITYTGVWIKFYWWFGSCSRLQNRTVLHIVVVNVLETEVQNFGTLSTTKISSKLLGILLLNCRTCMFSEESLFRYPHLLYYTSRAWEECYHITFSSI